MVRPFYRGISVITIILKCPTHGSWVVTCAKSFFFFGDIEFAWQY